jgi:hypothetical protein
MTFSIETLVEDAIIARLAHSATLAALPRDGRYAKTDHTEDATWIHVAATDEGEEAPRSGIRKVRVDVALHYNLHATGHTAAELQELYDLIVSYLDDANAETALSTASLLVIGVRREGYGSARDQDELVSTPTITRQLLAQNISV